MCYEAKLPPEVKMHEEKFGQLYRDLQEIKKKEAKNGGNNR